MYLFYNFRLLIFIIIYYSLKRRMSEQDPKIEQESNERDSKFSLSFICNMCR